MSYRKIQIIIFLLLFCSASQAEDLQHLVAKVKPGDGAYHFLKRYGLTTSDCNLNYFKEINNLPDDLVLVADRAYKLPVIVYKYNGTSIRSTIGINDWDLARKIQSFNEKLHRKGLRSADYRSNNILWVPYDILNCNSTLNEEKKSTKVFPIFGPDYEEVTITDTRLTNQVYYIVAGHGGPDPGAMSKYKGYTLCEDEYAYDIALRMARKLLEHNATVYMIVRDHDDGIRSGEILKADNDEVHFENKTIPINQVARLNQRCDVINDLYKQNKKRGAKKQRAIILHLDSRGDRQRVDMFFYHSPKSKQGKKLAYTLRNTIEEKYNTYQKNRGYNGTVKARNLHMLRETNPVAVFIELGNIRNSSDQKRFVIEDNRQAVANWLVDGLIRE
jgi:N-acetylmuramoyl-L-alanine amidase